MIYNINDIIELGRETELGLLSVWSSLSVLFVSEWAVWFPSASQKHAENCVALDLPQKREVGVQNDFIFDLCVFEVQCWEKT